MTNPEPQPLQPDPNPDPIAPPCPGSVATAIVLMWLHFALALCIPSALAVLLLLRLSDVESGPIEASELRDFKLLSGLFLLCGGAFLTLVGILAVKLRRRRSWARITTLALNGLVILVILIAAVTNLLVGVSDQGAFLPVAYEAAIAICLCTPSARAWFTKPRNEPESPLVAASAEGKG